MSLAQGISKRKRRRLRRSSAPTKPDPHPEFQEPRRDLNPPSAEDLFRQSEDHPSPTSPGVERYRMMREAMAEWGTTMRCCVLMLCGSVSVSGIVTLIILLLRAR